MQGDCFADAAAIGLIVSSTPLTEARNDKLLCKRRKVRRLHKRFVPDSYLQSTFGYIVNQGAIPFWIFFYPTIDAG